jgi:hypothetical protein
MDRLEMEMEIVDKVATYTRYEPYIIDAVLRLLDKGLDIDKVIKQTRVHKEAVLMVKKRLDRINAQNSPTEDE